MDFIKYKPLLNFNIPTRMSKKIKLLAAEGNVKFDVFLSNFGPHLLLPSSFHLSGLHILSSI